MKADYEWCGIIKNCDWTAVISISFSQIKTLEGDKGEQGDNMLHKDSHLPKDSLQEIEKTEQIEVNDSDPCIDNKEEEPKVDHDVSCPDKLSDEISLDVSKVKDQKDDECVKMEDIDVCNDNLCIEKEVNANSTQEVKVSPNAAAMHISIFTE